MSASLRRASRSAASSARRMPGLDGLVRCAPSLTAPYPEISARMSAPRLRAELSDSSTRMAAPSPSTMPSRSRLKGRHASHGGSLRSVMARRLDHACTIEGPNGVSVPPTTAAVSRLELMRQYAYPIAWADDAHAASIVIVGPVRRNRIDALDVGALFMMVGRLSGSLTTPSSKYRSSTGSIATNPLDDPPMIAPTPSSRHRA